MPGLLATVRSWFGAAAKPAAPEPPPKKRRRGGNSAAGGRASVAIARTCPHCGTTVKGPVYFRTHGDKCKRRPASEPQLPLEPQLPFEPQSTEAAEA